MIHDLRAAGVKGATGRRIDRVRIGGSKMRIGNAESRLRRQNRPEQGLRVRMLR